MVNLRGSTFKVGVKVGAHECERLFEKLDDDLANAGLFDELDGDSSVCQWRGKLNENNKIRSAAGEQGSDPKPTTPRHEGQPRRLTLKVAVEDIPKERIRNKKKSPSDSALHAQRHRKNQLEQLRTGQRLDPSCQRRLDAGACPVVAEVPL